MDINATFFVQIFNFFIVYWMLRFFLFKPVITIIQHEEEQEKALGDIIDQQKKSLEIQEKERQRHWHNCQEYFINHQPYISKNIPQIQSFLADEKYDDVKAISSLSINTDAVSKIRNALEEKIKHVH